MTCHCFLRPIRKDLTSSPILHYPGKKKTTLSCLILFHRHDKARKIDVFGRELGVGGGGRGDISLTFLAIFLKKYSIFTRVYRLKVTVWRGLVHLLNVSIGQRCNIERLPFFREISMKIFLQIVLVFFLFAPKTRVGLSCTVCIMPINSSLSVEWKPGYGHPHNWLRVFG